MDRVTRAGVGAALALGLLASSQRVSVAAPDPVDSPEGEAAPGAVVIGSKNFTESRLLAEIMAQLIESNLGLEVVRRTNLGGTALVFAALQSGEIDLYPEYTGTGWSVLLRRSDKVQDPLRAYVTVQREFESRFGLEWLSPFGFNNSYALAMTAERAEQLGIRSISDLLPHAAELRAGVSHEFLERADGFPGLLQVYGLELAELRGIEHGLAYSALESGQIDLTDTYTTDGKLLRYDLRLLQDDRAFFPPYDCAPIVRAATLARHPRLRSLFARLAFRIDDASMRRLNAQVEEGGGAFEATARAFLEAESLLAAAPQRGNQSASIRAGSPWELRQLLPHALRHLALTAVSVCMAIGVAVPLGIALTRRRALAPAVLGAAGVVQTVPSLALLALMIYVPGLGLGARSAIAALFLYALLPITRNTFAGIRAVDPDTIDAARGLGLSDFQLLTRVQLPLASATILAGVRTAAVIAVGMATLAAFVGAGGLGDFIMTGLQLNDTSLVLAGAVPAAVLALLIDGLMAVAERWLVPKPLRARAQ